MCTPCDTNSVIERQTQKAYNCKDPPPFVLYYWKKKFNSNLILEIHHEDSASESEGVSLRSAEELTGD